MKTKRILIVAAVAIFSIVAFAPHSWAGSANHHRIEGAVIGIGAIILGKAILDANRHYPADTHATVVYRPHPRPRPRPAGHWETTREWVPPKYEKVWNPGHYNRRGHWVRGHWTRIETERGYWHSERVWVPYH